MKKRILSLLIIISLGIAVLPSSASTRTITTNQLGKHNGYDFEFWSQFPEGGSMTLGAEGTGGAFSCEWDGVFNILFRTGKKYNRTQTYEQLGEISIEYEATRNVTKGNVSYLAVYGWLDNPLVEYYIIEARGSYNPGSHGTNMGSITVDGGVYDIWVTERVNQPSINGTATFKQYWSIRRDNRTSGIISVSEHFRAWEKAGMDMSGKMYEIAFTVEAFGGEARNAAGSADITKMEIIVGEAGGNAAVTVPVTTAGAIAILRDVAAGKPGVTTADAVAILKQVAAG